MSDDGMSWANVKSRSFRHVNGFRDITDYVEILEDESTVLHKKDGSSRNVGVLYGLRDCLDHVKRGRWEEITDELVKV